MDASIESMLELMRSEITGFDVSLSRLSALLPDAQFLWIAALVTAFYLLCIRDEARSDHARDRTHLVEQNQDSAAAKAPVTRPAAPRSWTEAMI